MELVLDMYHHCVDRYEYFLTFADKRVANWTLMGAYSPTLALTACYLIAIWLLPKFMQNREPFRCQRALFIYNIGLVALNFHILKELFTASWNLNYSYSCQPVNYSDDPDEIRIAAALWWYYFSKLVEFMDTIFFILRKKNSQVTFLHVYHHASMFPLWWIGIKWVAGGQAFFGAQMNSFIHVLMYSYYGLSALGPHMQPYLWWKRYLTTLQLVQFIVGMLHGVNSIVVKCDFPEWMAWGLLVYGTTILSLFLNFYYQTYINPSKTKKQKSKKQEINGMIPNGTASNGRLEGKKQK